MIERYTLPEMARLWSTEHRLEVWLRVELLACEGWSREGAIPSSALDKMRKKARIDPRRMAELEATLKHDVLAFLTAVGETVGEEARFLHLGMTSSDLLDTALAVLLCEAADRIIADLDRLSGVLKRRAFEFKDTVMIGRTHGMHAEPITFGLKLARWYEQCRRHRRRLVQAREEIAVGKISGAVGTFVHVTPAVEAYVCEQAGLRPEPVASQVVARDRHAAYLATLAVVGSGLDEIATELRHLQRTEVLEVEESFTRGQKGSSAMPHKKNPISAENLCGLARLVRAYAQVGLEDVALWHERDISHSSVERVALPDATTLLDFMLNRLADLLETLQVYPERMRRNLDLSGGPIFSQRVLLELVRRGASREEAYQAVQRQAHASGSGDEFRKRLLQDPLVTKYLASDEIESCFDLGYYLREVDTLFKRVFSA
jgi:adenylosuccinate lyase